MDSLVTRADRELLVREMLLAIGEDPTRDGLIDTPTRVVKSWGDLFCGYEQDPDDLFTVFEVEGCNEMVVLKDIEFVSYCEHHLMPFTGVAHIGYIPNGGVVVGVSKLARLLDCFSRRLQIQERIGMQVTEKLMQRLRPAGCGCILSAQHTCVSCRGVGKQNSTMVTSSMRGVFMDAAVRQEFLRMVGL